MYRKSGEVGDPHHFYGILLLNWVIQNGNKKHFYVSVKFLSSRGVRKNNLLRVGGRLRKVSQKRFQEC